MNKCLRERFGLVFGMASLILFVSLGVTVMSQHDQEQIAESVEYLWSSNDSERNAGIERILQIGSPAVDLLLRSLVALTEDQYPRFPKGRRPLRSICGLNGNSKRMMASSTTNRFLLKKTPSRSLHLMQG